MRLTGAQALVRCLLAEQVRLRVRHRRRQAGAAAACAVAARRRSASSALRHEAAGADDGRGGVRRHRPHGGGARRDGAGRPQPGVGRGRRLQQQPAAAADHHQPAPRRGLSAQRHVHGPGHARRVRAADQVECGGARRAPHPGAGAHARSARRSAAGPGRCTWTSRRTCWRPTCDFADDEFDVAPSRYRALGGPRPAARRGRRGGRAAARRAAPADRGRRRRRAEPAPQTLVRELAARAARAGGADADGARRGRQRQPALHRPRRPDRRRGGARRPSSEADVDRSASAAASRRWMWDEHGPFARRHAPRTSTSTSIRPRSAQPALHEVAMQADARRGAATTCSPRSAPRAARSRGRLAAGACAPRARATKQGWPRWPTTTGAGDAPGRAGQRDRPRAAARRAGGLRRRPHHASGATTSRRCTTVRTRFHDPGMSHLGFGLPYALALQLQHPRPAGVQHHRRRLVRLHAAGARHRAALPAAGDHAHPQQRGLGHHPRRPAQAVRLRVRHRAGRHRLRRDRARLRLPRRDGRRAPTTWRRRSSARCATGLPAVLDCRTRFVPHPACRPSAA